MRSPGVGAGRFSRGTTARSSGRDTAPASGAPTPGIPTYCPNCEAVCGSTFQGALCGCDGCPHCAELAHIALEKWLGTTPNPQDGAL